MGGKFRQPSLLGVGGAQNNYGKSDQTSFDRRRSPRCRSPLAQDVRTIKYYWNAGGLPRTIDAGDQRRRYGTMGHTWQISKYAGPRTARRKIYFTRARICKRPWPP